MLVQPSRPPGRRTIDLAGPRLRDLPTRARAQNLLIAESTAKELSQLSLSDALDLIMLIARKDPRRHPHVAARWLLCYLEEYDDATIDEAAMVAARLAALAADRQPAGRGADASSHRRESD
jgi:hypothetical protein